MPCCREECLESPTKLAATMTRPRIIGRKWKNEWMLSLPLPVSLLPLSHPAVVSSPRRQIFSSRKPQPLDLITDTQDGATINTSRQRSSLPLPYFSLLQKIPCYSPTHPSSSLLPIWLFCYIPLFIPPYPSYPSSLLCAPHL